MPTLPAISKNAFSRDKIILFGSRAKGTATEESDIDLMVVYFGPKSTREVQLEIQRLFLTRDFSMDVFVLTPQYLDGYKRIIKGFPYLFIHNGRESKKRIAALAGVPSFWHEQREV